MGPFFETDNPKLWWRKWHNWDYVEEYWYQQGRRDNAFVLRGLGYPQMAEEHEEKYGPGLFQQMNETLSDIESGIDDKSPEEVVEITEKLKIFREEMIDCTDIPAWDRKELLDELDSHLEAFTAGEDLGQTDDENDGDGFEYEFEETVNEDPNNEVIEVYEEDEGVEESNIQAELGLE